MLRLWFILEEFNNVETPIKGGSQREEKGRTAEKGLGGTSALSCGEERNLIKQSRGVLQINSGS